jgi:cytochrome o ubiquinol oxidase subunit 1
MKQHKYQRPEQGFKAIHMPKNTAAGIILAGISTVLGFALIWHMWLLAGVSFAALLATAIGHTFNYDRDYHIPAEEVERVEAERTRMLASHV